MELCHLRAPNPASGLGWLARQILNSGAFAFYVISAIRIAQKLADCAKQMPGGCVEEGYLPVPVGYCSGHAGEAEKAHAAFFEAADIGERFGDKDLIALARRGQGRALIRKGEIVRGVALLDEVMVGWAVVLVRGCYFILRRWRG